MEKRFERTSIRLNVSIRSVLLGVEALAFHKRLLAVSTARIFNAERPVSVSLTLLLQINVG